jgi:hypothetical protein
MATPKLVLIEWEDAEHKFGWLDELPSDNPEQVMCHTVGWLMVKTKKHVVVAQTISADDALAQTLQIPMGMVHSITPLVTGAKSVNKSS